MTSHRGAVSANLYCLGFASASATGFAGASLPAAVFGANDTLTTLLYLLSAPFAESMIDDIPAVSRISTAMLAAIVAEVPQ
jgi:hypothetical protein